MTTDLAVRPPTHTYANLERMAIARRSINYHCAVNVAKKRGNAVGVSWRGQTIKAPRQSPH
jgi:hypothetical protein